MKQLTGLFVFIISFVVAGVVMHMALYEKAGIFIWSFSENPATGTQEFRRTVFLPEISESRLFGAEVKADETKAANKSQPEVAVEAEPKGEGEAQPKAEKPEKAPEEPAKKVALFNGKDLGDWEKTQFGGEGDVFVNEDKNLEFGFGAIMTGVNWGGKVPATSNYEIRLDAMKLDGTDFFCALTFPVKDSHATFVMGGWGGGIVGISNVDDLNASENETMNIEGFEKDKWFKVRVRVSHDKLEAWIDEDQMVDLELRDRKISLLPGDIELSAPLGIASYMTRSQYRNIVWENLDTE